MVMPSSQWFGSGLGHRGSTSNTGACTVGPDPALLSSIAWQAASAARTATKPVPIARLRLAPAVFIAPPFGCKLPCPYARRRENPCQLLRRADPGAAGARGCARHPDRRAGERLREARRGPAAPAG